MSWAVIELLGIPVWLIIGVATVLLTVRRQVKRQRGVFPCKIRVEEGELAGLPHAFGRTRSYASWVHDVLVVRRGVGLIRTAALAVRVAEGAAAHHPASEVPGLGDEPVVVPLRLDDGTRIVLAVPAEWRDDVVGPFLNAAMTRYARATW